MSVVFIKKVSEYAHIGLWKIEESIDELLSPIHLSDVERALYNSKRNVLRKKEWLACRNLLKIMLPENDGIYYNPEGRPFLNNNSSHISISHSGDYACIYINEQNPVGIDIQRLKPDISKGVDFFLSPKELSQFDTSDNTLLHILWSAKETVYKFLGHSDIDVKKDIYLLPFQRNQTGSIEVNILHIGSTKTLFLRYEMLENYILTRTN
ncbi:4'-phosphopantetheinyl transferase superfamily protein [Dyadobacter sp. CY312]|uniref:4'-phosphopantetheinyl transferase family protein n=1 Tax=Dyadobacter sp. CY312 TaxID=2907303 RepID=UPI001F476857|nr:4'-phosphopantetheinyl transferase superfamily protein [Dyadobacter sp. CY312]MCE7041588.1 4'-phosphopantetheinyl transferase superfamily protein [Dyadobacter sp. CY312]